MNSSIAARKPRCRDSGAAMAEFALIAVVVIGTIGFFYEIGVAYYHQHLLAHTVTKMARQIAVNVGNGTDVNSMDGTDGEAATRCEEYMEDYLGQNTADVTFDSTVYCRFLPGAQCSVHIKGTWPVTAFFGIYLPGGLSVKASAEAIVEDECFTCAGCTVK